MKNIEDKEQGMVVMQLGTKRTSWGCWIKQHVQFLGVKDAILISQYK